MNLVFDELIAAKFSILPKRQVVLYFVINSRIQILHFTLTDSGK